MPRPLDPAWEALVEVTAANPAFERGKLNLALRAIREAWQMEGGTPEGLAKEIELRAQAYRRMWPTMALTPPALAAHWRRVMVQQEIRNPQQQALDELRKEDP